MPPNIFSMKSFDEGYARQEGFRKRSADANAAGRIAAGDYRGAAGEYANQGLAPQAADMMGAQSDMDQQQRQNQRQDMGDQTAAAQRGAEALKSLATGLKSVPAGQRLQALQSQSQMLQQLGVPPQALQGVTEDQLSDQALDMLSGEVEKHFQQMFQNDTGLYGVTPKGGVETLQTFERKPTIVPSGSVALDPNGKPLYTNPKTFAPKAGAAPGGGRYGATPHGPVIQVDPSTVKWN